VLVARTARGPAHILLPALVVGATGRFLLYPSLEIRHHWPAAFSLCLVLLAVIAKERSGVTGSEGSGSRAGSILLR
jgi:hypothetical protein